MTTIAWALFALLISLSALYVASTWLLNRTIRDLEARLGALTLARTPGEYVGLLNARIEKAPTRPHKVKTHRGREIDKDDDRFQEIPKIPIGLGGEW